jgi:hypothetical protein
MKKKKVLAAIIVSAILLSLAPITQFVEVAKANPTWGKPSTPIPPITDPPQIIITTPNSQEYSNPIPLNITIIQPDSWESKHNMTLPNSWVDNSDTVVVGQNTLRSITCTIDDQTFNLWNGTYFGFGLTYYLPRETQFSALINASKGQHNLQVNVSAISEYIVEGIIPFAQRNYDISASQTTRFNVKNDSDSTFPPTLYSVKSSYEIWQSSSDPTSPSTPTSTGNSIETPTPTPNLLPSTPSPSPKPSPTQTTSSTPTATFTPTQTESPSTSNSITPSPSSAPSTSIPEFPSWIVVFLLAALIAAATYSRWKRNKK